MFMLHNHRTLMVKVILISLFALFPNVVQAAAEASNYTLEIIAPRAGLSIINRYYMAYPALEYKVPVAVIGGSYPFTYSLTTAPSGMTIDVDTGYITWSNPTTVGSPHDVTASVVDQESTTKTVAWTITVQTANFIFVDSVNGNDANDGTVANPFKLNQGWYTGTDTTARDDSTYAEHFLYFRTGTYFMDGYTDGANVRMPLVNLNKPMVWLAYPGESPVIDLSDASLHAQDSGAGNFYMGGLDITNVTNSKGRGIMVASSGQDITFFENELHNLPTTGSPGGNQSLIFIRKNSQGSYKSFINNEFYDVGLGYGILAYRSDRVLFADNTMHDFDDDTDQASSHTIGPKESNTMWFIRNNHLFNIGGTDSEGVWGYGDNQGGVDQADIEISYNRILMNGAGTGVGRPFHIHQKSNADPPSHGKVFLIRNTFVGGAPEWEDVATHEGPFVAKHNVIVNEVGIAGQDNIVHDNVDADRVTLTDNLIGNAADAIVDANGQLQGSSRTTWLGLRGYELGLSGAGWSSGSWSNVQHAVTSWGASSW